MTVLNVWNAFLTTDVGDLLFTTGIGVACLVLAVIFLRGLGELLGL